MPNVDYIKFCNENHIQGSASASIRLGLYYKDEPVSLISLGKPRYNSSTDWELIRSCNKINTSVMGGFSKLFNYFKNNYSGSVITYSDVRYFSGEVYLKSGFEFKQKTEPCYYYFKKNELKLYHRSTFQKHKLKSKLEIFDESKTEKENMANNGYLHIYDCGNLVFVYS